MEEYICLLCRYYLKIVGEFSSECGKSIRAFRTAAPSTKSVCCFWILPQSLCKPALKSFDLDIIPRGWCPGWPRCVNWCVQNFCSKEFWMLWRGFRPNGATSKTRRKTDNLYTIEVHKVTLWQWIKHQSKCYSVPFEKRGTFCFDIGRLYKEARVDCWLSTFTLEY
jgi:hypothetical protein